MWNDIELLTNDDTGSGYLSVGSRKEHGTALYQVDLLAKISSEKEACNFDLKFSDTEVDVVGLCQEGKFLLVGERSGNLHLIHVTSKQTLLTNAFVQKANDENQCTYRNLVIEKDSSNEAIEKVDFHTAKKGTGNCAFSKWEPDSSRKGMTVKSVIDAEIIEGAKKFQLIDNLLFVLDTSSLTGRINEMSLLQNVLSLWDIYTLTPIWNWPSLHIEDFLLTTEADSPSSVTWYIMTLILISLLLEPDNTVNRLTGQGITNLKLVALTTTTNKKMRNLMVYSLPMMEILYSLEVSSVSSLVQTGISTDTIYLLEGICKNDPK
ncbi:hypothetical protein J1605_012745 [Eschrichtius robustus]|uniref:KNTC1 N-terminal domain-containing protein n=1 Tax=Eschrichtius robustus TaxID=9764 RepID=A0AB34GH31_ESCRO|nr:hypothetical protein J1605_012745 [Eschrichtius robustus]